MLSYVHIRCSAVALNTLPPKGIPGAFAAVPGITDAVEAAASTAYKSAYAQAFKMVFYAT